MTKQPNPKTIFIIIDTFAYIYRAYHAYPKLVNQHKFPVGAIYGFLSMINKLLTTYHSKYIIFVFDSKIKNFRHYLYTKYKANRKSMPFDLYRQITPIKELIKFLGFNICYYSGLEADDIIGNVAKWLNISYIDQFFIIISTIDKDLFQLINRNTFVHNLVDQQLYHYNKIKAKYGLLNPNMIINYLSLLGDSSDNISGVPGIGKVAAVKICNKFNTLSNLFKNLDNILEMEDLRNRYQIYDSLLNYQKTIKLNYQLIKIKYYHELIAQQTLEQYEILTPQLDKLIYHLQYYNLTYWKKKINSLLSLIYPTLYHFNFNE